MQASYLSLVRELLIQEEIAQRTAKLFEREKYKMSTRTEVFL